MNTSRTSSDTALDAVAVASGYDVAIFGGGPAGLAVAIELTRQGLDVLVIERSDYAAERVGEHLPPGAKRQLRAVGIADPLDSGRHVACHGIRSVWGRTEPYDKDYIAHPDGAGLNLTRPDFDLRLATVASGLGVTVVTQSRLATLTRDGVWQISLVRHRRQLDIRADMLIDATGRSASIAKRLGARPIAYDRLVALVGRTKATEDDDATVLIEAVENGWWYSAGLANGAVVATFLSDHDLLPLSEGERATAWLQALQSAKYTVARCPRLLAMENLVVRTARTQCLSTAAGEGWLATGDAAMSFDPLSSEGISKAFAWATYAADATLNWRRGDRQSLQRYDEKVETTFVEYLRLRHTYYRVEKRWPDAPFWARRRMPPRPV